MAVSLKSRTVVPIIYIICFVTTARSQWIYEDTSCITPDNEYGNCVSVSFCSHYVNALRTLRKPLSPEIIKKMQAYQCQANSREIKVCCPSDPIVLKEELEPKDVSTHRNVYLLPENCGLLNTDSKIINGQDAGFNEFPWMTLLGYNVQNSIKYLCGGSIISKNYILTAAHCIIDNQYPPPIFVRVGEYSLMNKTDCITYKNKKTKCNPSVQDVIIEEAIPHPDFDYNNYKNDMGLLRVSTIDFGRENVKPVCLPISDEHRTAIIKTIIVTGWGKTNVTTGTYPDILQKVSLKVVDRDICSNSYRNRNFIIEQSQLCATGPTSKRQDVCGGDSGGPMHIATINADYNPIYLQLGIISFGPKMCGHEDYPAVYTLVTYYMDWILNTLRR